MANTPTQRLTHTHRFFTLCFALYITDVNSKRTQWCTYTHTGTLCAHHQQQLSWHPPPVCCAVHMVSPEWEAVSGEWEKGEQKQNIAFGLGWELYHAVKSRPVTEGYLCLQGLRHAKDNDIIAFHIHTIRCHLSVSNLHPTKVRKE